MNEGKMFEQDFKGSCEETNHYYLRLKDTAKWLKGEGSVFTPENPCDALLFTLPFLWLLEMKSTKSTSVSFYANTPYKKPEGTTTQVMIKPNQVRSLMESVKHDGVIAGFVINFRARKLKTKTTENKCYFVHISDFMRFVRETGRSTISDKDCAEIGIEISNTLKKVRYRYDINTFVDECIELYKSRELIKLEHLEYTKEWIKGVDENV